MNRTKLYNILLSVALSLIIFSCKDDDVLPPLTLEGEGIFACYVNDDVWVAETVQGVSEPKIEAAYFQNSDFLIITARRKGANIHEVIEFTIYTLDGTGTYTIGLHAKGEGTFLEFKDSGQIIYRTSSQRGGSAELKLLDFNKKIVSGEFKFNTVDAYGNEKDITEGRFDVKFVIYD